MERVKYVGEDACRNDLGTFRSKPGWLEKQHSLPFESLSPDEFEIFCYLLLRRENPGENIFYYGKTGDSGRDIIHQKKDNSLELIQCKRHTASIGVSKIRTEMAKLYLNICNQVIPENPNRVTFYIVPDLTALAQDIINYPSQWIEQSELFIRQYLKKKPTQKLLDSILSWSPQFSKQTAIDLTERARNYKELTDEFFSYKKVIDSDNPKLNTILTQVEDTNSQVVNLTAIVQDLMKTCAIPLKPQSPDASSALRDLLRKAEEENPGLGFIASHDSQKIVITVVAKSSVQSVLFATLSFPNTEAGKRGIQKFKTIIEEGRPIQLLPSECKWILNFNLPEICSSPLETEILFFYPQLPNCRVPVRLEVLNDTEVVTAVNFTYLRLVRAGTCEMEFLVEGKQITGKITLILYIREKKLTIDFSDVDVCAATAVQARNTLAIMFALYQGGKFRVTSLDDDTVLIDEKGIVLCSNISEKFDNTLNFLNCLVRINKEFSLDIRFPETLNEEIVQIAKLAVSAIEQGQTEHPEGVLRLTYRRQEAWEIVNSLLQTEELFSLFIDGETEYELLGHVLPMGMTSITFENIVPINGLRALEKAVKELPESSNIEIALRYNREVKRFQQWFPEA